MDALQQRNGTAQKALQHTNLVQRRADLQSSLQNLTNVNPQGGELAAPGRSAYLEPAQRCKHGS